MLSNAQRKLVTEILNLQDEVYFAGGTYIHSSQYKALIVNIKVLLESLDFEFNPENVRMIFDCPFTPEYYDIFKDQCNILVCTKKEAKVREIFVNDIIKGRLLFNLKPLDVALRRACIEANLLGLSIGE